MMTESHPLRRAARDFIDGKMKPLDLLAHSFEWMPENIKDSVDPAVDELAGTIFLLVSEWTYGDRSEDSIREELATMLSERERKQAAS